MVPIRFGFQCILWANWMVGSSRHWRKCWSISRNSGLCLGYSVRYGAGIVGGNKLVTIIVSSSWQAIRKYNKFRQRTV